MGRKGKDKVEVEVEVEVEAGAGETLPEPVAETQADETPTDATPSADLPPILTGDDLLNDVHPALAAIVRAAFAASPTFAVVSGLRSIDAQVGLRVAGVSRELTSWHTSGQAVDLIAVDAHDLHAAYLTGGAVPPGALEAQERVTAAVQSAAAALGWTVRWSSGRYGVVSARCLAHYELGAAVVEGAADVEDAGSDDAEPAPSEAAEAPEALPVADSEPADDLF